MYYTNARNKHVTKCVCVCVYKKPRGTEQQKFTKVKIKAVEGIGEEKQFWGWCRTESPHHKWCNFFLFCIGTTAYKIHCHDALLPFLLTVLRFCALKYKLVCVHMLCGAWGWPGVSSSVIPTLCSETWSLAEWPWSSCSASSVSVPSHHCWDHRHHDQLLHEW